MLVAVVGTTLLVALVIADWLRFTGSSAGAAHYGCRVARHEDILPIRPSTAWTRFDHNGLLTLPSAMACRFGPTQAIVLRHVSHRFRTAWPLKGTVELQPGEHVTRVILSKRIPWSSAILTLLWFGLVGAGTVGFVVAFFTTDGLTSLSALLLGVGVTGMGLLVLLFGMIIVALAYRLEDSRLTSAYQDLRRALHPPPATADLTERG